MTIQTHTLGFPRIGDKRELKFATEKFWKGKISKEELLEVAKEIRIKNWKRQKEAGISKIPSNDFSFYDQVLDTTALLGAIPERFNFSGDKVDLETYFLCARGKLAADVPKEGSCTKCSHNKGTTALEMTKWFDTNYHYLVPEFSKNQNFSLSATKIFDEYLEAKELGIETVPVILGPISYLYLGKEKGEKFDKIDLLPKVIEIYKEIFAKLAELGAEWIQIDEPILSLDISENYIKAYEQTYKTLKESVANTNIKFLLANYFGNLGKNSKTIFNLSVDGIHLDFVRGIDDLKNISEFPKDKILSVGIVNGRNIWRNDYKKSLNILDKISENIEKDRLWISSSCSLLHSPVSLKLEEKLDSEIISWLRFSEEKLIEIKELALIVENGITKEKELYEENQKVIRNYNNSERVHNTRVQEKYKNVDSKYFTRGVPFKERIILQQEKLNLPKFPTTTIGSDPQTKDIRKAHKEGRKGIVFSEDLKVFLKGKIKESIKIQEDLGLDVLVHGEYERNDMVEFFGQRLEGFTFTSFGWVQSFGSRYVKPPIIFGDVERLNPITVEWSEFAQSCTDKPVKGMLTGPITILQWSFVREDIPRKETSWQIALAVREEVLALEKAGIKVIQIDEPALREGLPLRKQDWKDYLDWAVKAFQISASGVKPETQVHTHMCYCEFEDVIQEIADLDADVISIENSRSDEALVKVFADFKYPNHIGLGVWDIHSPRVPTIEEIRANLQKTSGVLDPNQIWINPDCGLKTREWPEVIDSLRNMVTVAKEFRGK